MAITDLSRVAAVPLLRGRPRLRFIDGAPEGTDGDSNQPGTGEPSDLDKALAEAAKWKSLSRKNEDRAKANEEKAKRLDELEAANQSEQEKLLARAEAAEKKLAEREAQDAATALRSEVAKEKGFGDRQIPETALRGATRDELEAHADELLALLPAPQAAPGADGQGDTGTHIGDGEMSADDIVDAALSR